MRPQPTTDPSCLSRSQVGFGSATKKVASTDSPPCFQKIPEIYTLTFMRWAKCQFSIQWSSIGHATACVVKTWIYSFDLKAGSQTNLTKTIQKHAKQNHADFLVPEVGDAAGILLAQYCFFVSTNFVSWVQTPPPPSLLTKSENIFAILNGMLSQILLVLGGSQPGQKHSNLKIDEVYIEKTNMNKWKPTVNALICSMLDKLIDFMWIHLGATTQDDIFFEYFLDSSVEGTASKETCGTFELGPFQRSDTSNFTAHNVPVLPLFELGFSKPNQHYRLDSCG